MVALAQGEISMHSAKISNLFRAVSLGIPLAAVAGCPFLDMPGIVDQPPLEAFNAPDDATLARVRGGDAIAYVVAQTDQSAFSFFLAEPGESREEHELIATVPASDFGFTEGEPLPTPTTISFADDLERAVIGFEDGSFVLESISALNAQLLSGFRVTPLTPLDEPVFNPSIDPFGTRVAFETSTGRIGTGNLSTGGIQNVGLLDRGVNPIFGSNGNLGFSTPEFDSFFVSDFSRGKQTTFDIGTVGFRNFDSPFGAFEAGLRPDVVADTGTFVTTTPLTIDTGPF
jgi:hypothetical protein